MDFYVYYPKERNMSEKKLTKSQQGAKNRRDGAAFERKVRKDLESKGWIVDKWSNNVDLEEGKLIPAKHKFNPYNHVMAIGTGFPDFIAHRTIGSYYGYYELIGVECKCNGKLSKVEKEKCRWLIDNNIFPIIYVASKDGKEIIYSKL